MAYNNSETINANTHYNLGDYQFNCVFDDSGSMGTRALASMKKDGQTVYKSVQIPNNAQIQGYSVEANETEATVYAVIKVPSGEGEEAESDLPTKWDQPIQIYGSLAYTWGVQDLTATGNILITANNPNSYVGYCFVSSEPGVIGHETIVIRPSPIYDPGTYEFDIRNIDAFSVTRHGKTAYCSGNRSSNAYNTSNHAPYVATNPNGQPDANTIWTAVYGRIPTEYETKEIMVGRFAIELEDAGGVGPGSDWTDPEDYDEDWEEGDPTHTLYVEVTGALSGRHNDPIVDPNYSYIPADKDTVKGYGCGGDGGHGGGGGAGASTVVIHKFATNQANSKDVTAIARRHGYGSGGGKGGKGGDGCILVYY